MQENTYKWQNSEYRVHSSLAEDRLYSLGIDTAPHLYFWYMFSPKLFLLQAAPILLMCHHRIRFKHHWTSQWFSNCALRSPKGSAGESRGHNREGPKGQNAKGGGPRASDSPLTQQLWFQLFLCTGFPLGLHFKKGSKHLKETTTTTTKPQKTPVWIFTLLQTAGKMPPITFSPR